jgi:hypothetical protein
MSAAIVPRVRAESQATHPQLRELREGVVKAVLPPSSLIDGNAATRLGESLGVVAGTRQVAVVLQVTGVTSVNRAAMAAFGAIPSVAAWAIVGESPVDRLIGHYMLRFRFGPRPARYFDSEDGALIWLASHRDAD